MKKLLLLVTILISTIALNAQDPECIRIFISEYVEGWSNNKAIELYNPTDADVDLSNYRLERFSNGGTSAGLDKQLPLEGIMPPFSVYVVVIDKRDSLGEGQEAPVWDELQAKADTFACPEYDVNNTMYFNGNDAMLLKDIAGLPFTIDRIGKVGENPGDDGWNDVGPDFTFAGNGETGWTKDHSLIRKPTVLIGDNQAGDTFDVSIDWDSIPPTLYDDEGNITGGNWASLGEHMCECGDVVDGINEFEMSIDLAIYPNPVVNQFTIESDVNLVEIEVYNMAGAKVYANQPMNSKHVITSSDWNSGVYLVNLKFENGYVTSKKIMVK